MSNILNDKDKELLDWYKSNKYKGNLSNKDYELNLNKGNYLYQNEILKNQKQIEEQNLQNLKNSQEQSVSISNEKLMKYLQDSQNASGIAQGQKGTDFIDANNTYLTNRAKINNDYAQNKQNLIDKYNTGIFENNTNYTNQEISILDKYRDIEKEQNQELKTEQDTDFNEFVSLLGYFSSSEEIDEFYNKFKGNLNSKQQLLAEQYINSYKRELNNNG